MIVLASELTVQARLSGMFCVALENPMPSQIDLVAEAQAVVTGHEDAWEPLNGDVKRNI
jgi:hypothetical protein